MKVFGKDYADSYDYLYQDKDYEKECDFLEEIFSKYSRKTKSILDLGCGTGGHAIKLAERGYDVLGVDRSEQMIGKAKKKTKESGLMLRFLKSDIKDLSIDERFDSVISMFAVISYQTKNADLERFCRIAKNHLKKDGLFIFDCWHGPAVLADRPGVRVKEIDIKDNGKIVRFTEPVLDILNHTVNTKFKVWKIEGKNLVKETKEDHLMRFLFPKEIEYYLNITGFKDIFLFPFLRLDKGLSEKDWNMTVVAR